MSYPPPPWQTFGDAWFRLPGVRGYRNPEAPKRAGVVPFELQLCFKCAIQIDGLFEDEYGRVRLALFSICGPAGRHVAVLRRLRGLLVFRERLSRASDLEPLSAKNDMELA